MTTENKIETANKKALHITECLSRATKEVRIDTPIGGVHIDSNNFNFTYIGKFGNNILMHLIRAKMDLNDLHIKLFTTAAHMQECSKNIGGITITTI